MSELERVNVDGDWVTREATGGGGSLPTGWTQDASDPASVDMHGGSLRDMEDGGGFVQMDKTNGFRSAPNDSPACFASDGGGGATVALDAGGLGIENAGYVLVDAGDTASTGISPDEYLATDGEGGQIRLNPTNGIISQPSGDGQTAFKADGTAGATVALDAGGLIIEDFSALNPTVRPAVPFDSTVQDLIDALVALGLVSQNDPV